MNSAILRKCLRKITTSHRSKDTKTCLAISWPIVRLQKLKTIDTQKKHCIVV